MAIKDLFNGFFSIEEDDDEFIEEEERRQEREQQSHNAQQPAKQQSERRERPRAIQSVPNKRQTTRMKSSQNDKQYQVAQKQEQGNVVSMNQAQENYQSGNSKMCLFEPRVFSDTQDIADELKNRRATLVNLQRIDPVSAKRIIDFLSGTVYAIGGDIQRVGADIFLCTPDNVEVAGSITDHIESMGNHYE
ncbi:cell division protein SepF [Staphylococcus coagulans]|uniref:cell division protein SepF n=1 Tax=Staphylococcus coagulans TaxID=74706 RepID=UPI000679F138|nr:cell division protein SepF [Staphylococcus coagulans]AKS67371.1 cell division protein SepF [Staphylococcus schleiferi]MBA8773741.1 cell division protein SepF [Staphylococcus coagulans]